MKTERDCTPFVPRQLDELGLDPPAFRVLCHLWRVTGPEGEFYEAVPRTAERCLMSVRAVHRALRWLVQIGLVHKVADGRGGQVVARFTPAPPGAWPTPAAIRAAASAPGGCRRADGRRVSRPKAEAVGADGGSAPPWHGQPRHRGADQGGDRATVDRQPCHQEPINRATVAVEGTPLKVLHEGTGPGAPSWSEVSAEIARTHRHVWATWVRPLDGRNAPDGALEVFAPGPQHAEWLHGGRSWLADVAARHRAMIETAARRAGFQAVRFPPGRAGLARLSA